MVENSSLPLAADPAETGGFAGRPSPREALFADAAGNHAKLIARIALSYEADPALRRDLVQDMLLALWIALDSFRGDCSLRTFIASVARKRAISHVTRRAREPRQEVLADDLVSAALAPDEVAMRNDLERHLAASIQKLPGPQRDAIVLCFEGFSYGEIGLVLGISPNAAMLRCQRAKASLKATIGRRH